MHCIFQSTKFKFLWIFKFDSAPCWAVVLIKKISLPLYLSIGNFLVNGLLKRRYHVYLYFLLCICVAFLSKRNLSSSLFSDLVVPPPRQCITREAFEWKSFCKSIVTIYLIIFLKIYFDCIFTKTAVKSLFNFRFGWAACQSFYPGTKFNVFKATFLSWIFLKKGAFENQYNLSLQFLQDILRLHFSTKKCKSLFIFKFVIYFDFMSLVLNLAILDFCVKEVMINGFIWRTFESWDM